MMVTLGSLLKKTPKYGINAAAAAHSSSLPAYIRITDIDTDGRFLPNPLVSVDSPLSRNYILQDGDIVIARTGASVGKSYRYRESDGELVFAGFLICITPDEKKLDPVFAGYYLQSKPYWDWIAAESVRSGQPGINAQQLMRLELDLPDIQHQREIGSRLSDVDNLISSLERLISKKQAIKQGMMQELLTGRTRLPGFSASWFSSTWGELALEISSGATPRRGVAEYWNGEIPWVTSTELKRGPVDSIPQSITTAGLRAANLRIWPAGTFLMAITGLEAAGTRGKCGLLPVAAATNQSCMAVAPGPDLDTEFLFYYYLHYGNDLAFKYVQGTKQQSYTAAIVKKLPIHLPSDVSEQQAIAQVLRDADHEIAALERCLESARNIKQGMMQELLTGRTRLPFEGESA